MPPLSPFSNFTPRALLRTPPFIPEDEQQMQARQGILPRPASTGLPRIAPPPEAPPSLPNMLPRPMPPDDSGVGVPLPSLSGKGAPTPYSPINKSKYDYTMEGAKRDEGGNLAPGGGFKRSGKDILRSALAGFGEGGIGGALAGAAGAAINPKAGREFLFNSLERPRLEREQADQLNAQKQMQTQGEYDLNRRMKEAQIRNIESETQARGLPKPAPARAPQYRAVVGPDGKPRYADITQPGEYTPYEKPPLEKPMTLAEAEAQRAAEEGSIGSIADSSLSGREESLKQKLTPRQRGIVDGTITPADDIEADQTMRRWDQIKQQERSIISRDTEQTARNKNALRIQESKQGKAAPQKLPAPTKSQSTGSGTTRKLSDLKKLLN